MTARILQFPSTRETKLRLNKIQVDKFMAGLDAEVEDVKREVDAKLFEEFGTTSLMQIGSKLLERKLKAAWPGTCV